MTRPQLLAVVARLVDVVLFVVVVVVLLALFSLALHPAVPGWGAPCEVNERFCR